ncbi:MAG: RsmB/NOP family class I SAM-dependent RNA methyltransferase [archaeon]
MEVIAFPDKDKIVFKKSFEERYQRLLGDRYEEYVRYSLSFLTRSIRVNTLKITIPKLKSKMDKIGWKLTSIPFCKEGFWVEHITGRLDIGNTKEHALGYYYVQEAASMVPPIVLDPEPGDIVLDMCASPGSKSTQLAQYLKNEGILVANDFTGDRMKPLGINIMKMGISNTILTMMYGQWFAKSGIMFDKILVDAPCSGTGTIRKSVKTLTIWNPIMIERLAATQRKLLATAYEVLKPGGTMVYSTCSSEPLEDEGVVSDFLEKHEDAKIEDIKLNINRSAPVTEWEGTKYVPDVKKCLRLWPQDNNTEGFFVAKIKKTNKMI